MAKKTGSRKKKTVKKRRKASVKARTPRKPTRTECVSTGIFKGHSFASIFDPGSGCDAATLRKWKSYLSKQSRSK
jgi:hypothetical protein